MLLKGKTALITGAGRGIGQSIAESFAREGCEVALSARSVDELEEVARKIEERGGVAHVLPCDLRNGEAVEKLVRDSIATLGGQIDLLINNAAYACFKPFEELSLEEWQTTLDVNLTACYHSIQAVLPAMKARKQGRIINISSVSGLKGIRNQTVYCASKFGLIGLTKALAIELREFGIGVSALCPGGVATRLTAENMPERNQDDWMTPEDIAHAALFMATQSDRTATDILHVRRFQGDPL